jgi:hypothetical protein
VGTKVVKVVGVGKVMVSGTTPTLHTRSRVQGTTAVIRNWNLLTNTLVQKQRDACGRRLDESRTESIWRRRQSIMLAKEEHQQLSIRKNRDKIDLPTPQLLSHNDIV